MNVVNLNFSVLFHEQWTSKMKRISSHCLSLRQIVHGAQCVSGFLAWGDSSVLLIFGESGLSSG